MPEKPKNPSKAFLQITTSLEEGITDMQKVDEAYSKAMDEYGEVFKKLAQE